MVSTPADKNDIAVLKYHERLKKLSATSFIKDLTLNFDESYPGGSFTCLQLLAFWLSWVRNFYVKDRKLRLSTELMNLLKCWSTKQDATKEERAFAKKLYEDFSRLPPIDADSNNTEESKSADAAETKAEKETSNMASAPASAPEPPPPVPPAPQLSPEESEINPAAESQAAFNDSYDRAADEKKIFNAIMRRWSKGNADEQISPAQEECSIARSDRLVAESSSAGAISSPLWSDKSATKTPKKKKKKKPKQEKKKKKKLGVTMSMLLKKSRTCAAAELVRFMDEAIPFDASGTCYRDIFGTSLTSDILAAAIRGDADPSAQFRVIYALSCVDRFATNLMFLSRDDQNALEPIVERFQNDDAIDSDLAKKLAERCSV